MSLEIAQTAVAEHGAQQHPSELAAMLDLVRQRQPGKLLEIGVYQGGTLYCWNQIGIPAVYAIDINFVHYTKLHGAWLYRGDSQNIEFRNFLGFEPGSMDVLFIDADHSYDGVKADYENWRHTVRGGGLIIFHDINDLSTGVPKLWEEVKNDALSIEISAGSHWGGFGILVRG